MHNEKTFIKFIQKRIIINENIKQESINCKIIPSAAFKQVNT